MTDVAAARIAQAVDRAPAAEREPLFAAMAPILPRLFPILLPGMLPRVLPHMIARVERTIDMPDYLRRQLPDLFPEVVARVMPTMLPEIAPRCTPALFDYLRGQTAR